MSEHCATLCNVSPPALSLQAWGDESIRTVAVAEPVYLLAAVVSETAACAGYREELTRFHTRGHKLHWRDLDADERTKSIELIASFDAYHVVVAGALVDVKRQERTRAHCLERLAWELDLQDVERLTLESRQTVLDKRDLRTIESMRGKRHLSSRRRGCHERPSADPMLWIADQLLGALGESMSGGNGTWFDTVRAATTVTLLDV